MRRTPQVSVDLLSQGSFKLPKPDVSCVCAAVVFCPLSIINSPCLIHHLLCGSYWTAVLLLEGSWNLWGLQNAIVPVKNNPHYVPLDTELGNWKTIYTV